MPLPSYVLSANSLICQQVLREVDGVPSAIRIVDIFYVPQSPPDFPDILPRVQVYSIVVIKAVPGYRGTHSLHCRLINAVGESTTVAHSEVSFASNPGLEEAPPNVLITGELNFIVRHFGLCYFCVDIDGEEIARSPIMLVQHPLERETS